MNLRVSKKNQIPSQLENELQKTLGPRNFSIRLIDRMAYARDSNFRSSIKAKYRANEDLPDIITWPHQVSQIQSLVKIAKKYSLKIVPFGAGSGVCQGTMGGPKTMTIDLKAFDKILDINPQNMTATVQAGMMGMHLEDQLARQGYTLGHFPSSIICASFGGYLAARSAGQTSARFGKIEDMVQSVSWVDGTGRFWQSQNVENSQGLDLNQIIVGSEGTLGLITEATVRIRKLSPFKDFAAYRFEDMATAMEAIRRIMQAEVRPSVVRLYDQIDTLLLLSSANSKGDKKEKKSLIDQVKHQFKSKAKFKALKGIFLAPKLFQKLTQYFPSGCMLILMHEGLEKIVKAEKKACSEILAELGAKDLGPKYGYHWYQHRYSVSFNTSPLFEEGAFTDTIEVATSWQNLSSLYDEMINALSPCALIMAHLSHVYPDGGSLYFTFSAPLKGPEKSLKTFDKIWQIALSTCQKNGGVISHHHGIGRLKKKFMADEWQNGIKILKGFKQFFDPDNLLNPGNLF